MNRVIVFGVAFFFAIVGIALLGGQQQAVAGHGCNGCHGAVACDGGNVGCAPVACSGDTGRCFGRNRCAGITRCEGRTRVLAVLGAKAAHAAKVVNVTPVVAPVVVAAAVRPPIAAVRLSLRIAVASPRKPPLRPRPLPRPRPPTSQLLLPTLPLPPFSSSPAVRRLPGVGPAFELQIFFCRQDRSFPVGIVLLASVHWRPGFLGCPVFFLS